MFVFWFEIFKPTIYTIKCARRYDFFSTRAIIAAIYLHFGQEFTIFVVEDMSMERVFCDIHTHHPRADRLSPTMAGVHPWDAECYTAIPDLSAADMVGETGLDYATDIDREAQKRLLHLHLAEAERLDKAVVVHCVKAFEELMKIVANYHLRGLLFHGFIGSTQQAKRCFERGYYLSFGERSLCSPRTREVIATAPAERLFVESDDNANCDIEELYRQIALLRNTSVEELRKQAITNYETLIKR